MSDLGCSPYGLHFFVLSFWNCESKLILAVTEGRQGNVYPSKNRSIQKSL